MQVQCLSPQTPASVAMCFQKKSCPVPFRQPTETNTLACNELRMLLCHRAVRKDKREKAGPKATDQGWRTKSGHSNNVPLLFDASSVLASADSSKRRDVLPRKMLPRAFSTVHRHNQASDATATAK